MKIPKKPEKRSFKKDIVTDRDFGYNERHKLAEARESAILEELEDMRDDIISEIKRRPYNPNIGKKGCLRRVRQLITAIKGKK